MTTKPGSEGAQLRRYTELNNSFYGGSDIEIECQKVQIVTTRYSHRCAGGGIGGHTEHTIPAGTVCVRETAKVDGRFGTCHTCFACLDAWEKEMRG